MEFACTLHLCIIIIMEIIAAGMATWSYEKTCELIELYRVEMIKGRVSRDVAVPHLAS